MARPKKQKKSKSGTVDPWESLKSILQDMDEKTGPSGFEGLVKNLLQRLTGESFILSRAGDQLGDARSFRAAVAVQVKRYKDTTSINDNDIEGEIYAIRAANRKLEVYVLAASRSVQFKQRLERIEAETGLDILVLDWTGPIFPLGALCVFYWDELASFPNLRVARLAAWAEKERNSDRVKQVIERLRLEISAGLHSFRKVRLRGSQVLMERFSLRPTGKRFDYVIRLRKSISRPAIEEQLLNWWRQKSSPIAYVEGQEGTGKSWATAQFARNAVCNDKVLVLWFDSRQWQGCTTIRSLLTSGFAFLDHDPQAQEKLALKALACWEQPILVVLDGVNERGCVATADNLLQNFSEIPKNFIRILFTTRPLESRPDFVPQLWRGITRIEVGAYNEDEFRSVLEMVVPNLRPDSFSAAVVQIARIPRYLETCLRLLQKLGKPEHLTKELVLWEDLLNRIDNDLQVRHAFGWTKPGDARSVLAKMASQSTQAEGMTSSEVLNRYFEGKYSAIRTDLEELRILEKADKFEAVISPSHLRLGWALFIESKLKKASTDDFMALADEIRAWLEPIASEDNRTEALYVALQLTPQDREVCEAKLATKRGALLYVWMRSHNAEISGERFDFWVRADLEAYCTFLEHLFTDIETERTQLAVIQPLLKLWVEGSEPDSKVIEKLRRWLLLTWFNIDVNEGDTSDDRLVKALTVHQVRLSAVAVSFLSVRPVLSLLDSLALCRATLNKSVVRRNEHSAPVKNLETNIGVALRWAYTETCLPHLQTLATKFKGDDTMLQGIRRLARSLRLRQLPTELRMDQESPGWSLSTEVFDRLKAGSGLFREEVDIRKTFFREIARLAIRDDLPAVSANDRDKIVQLTRDASAEIQKLAGASYTHEYGNLEQLLPWLAKVNPDYLGEVIVNLRSGACAYDHPAGLFPFILGTDQTATAEARERVLKDAVACGTRIAEHANDQIYTDWIIELGILTADDEKLLKWLTFVANTECLRRHSTVNPIPGLLSIRSTEEIREAAAVNLQRLPIERKSKEIRPSKVSEFDFWAMMLLHNPVPNSVLYEKVRRWLLDNQPGECSFFTLSVLVASATREQLETDISNPDFRSRIPRSRWYELWPLFDCIWESALKLSYEDLLTTFPQDFAGFMLFKSKRDGDFFRWGRELLDLAFELCEAQPFVPQHRGNSRFGLDEKGRVAWLGADAPNQIRTVTSAGPSSWGIDYSNSWTVLQEVPDNDRRDAEAYISDNKKLRYWDHFDIHTFSAEGELAEWGKRHPTEFIEKAQRYLKRLPHSLVYQYHLGQFTNSVLNCLLRVDPEFAFQRLLEGVSCVNTTTVIGVPDYAAVIWEVQNNSSAHQAVRRKLFEQADHDLEILELTISAIAGNSEVQLWQFVEDFLSRAAAKDRNLGVSILPWIGTKDALQRLERINADDPSAWVQDHAKWAINACKQEILCRQLYVQALDTDNSVQMSAYLHQLHPALSRAARFWRMDLEKAHWVSLASNRRKRGILWSFWSHWQAQTDRGTKIYERTLKEFCRGEKLESSVTSRLAPWWKPLLTQR
jgi:hypothetical protein